MIRLHNIKVDIKENIDLYSIVLNKLHIKRNEIKSLKIHKRSIDARSKKHFAYYFDLDVEVSDEEKYLNKFITKVENEEYIIPQMGNMKLTNRPVIIGAGPAGLFCAYHLAKYGYKPLIIERGEKIEDRVKSVDEFWRNEKFKENSNVQFGEGGAGTFSDGKLNTLVKDKENRMKEVFKIFVECGAPEEILYDYRPHIGTDKLREVIINMRKKIENWGGSFLYNNLVEDFFIENNKIIGVIANGKLINASVVVLAIGHSARDTFKILHQKGIGMSPKPFAVGVRIIHPQKMIDDNQYPINYSFLPPSSYKLTYKATNNHGVYSFCMCPGGYVVDARSSSNKCVVNGMSDYKRDSGYANSAIVVTVDMGTSLFAGLNFQEELEEKAYKLAEGKIPVQKYLDYKNNVLGSLFSCSAIKGKSKIANINLLFPDYINESLKEGIDYFDKIIPGFGGSDAIILAPESRTSSPIRINRSESFESNIEGLYPCGEGSGYAGGITTSAIDGIKVFEAICKKYKNDI